MSPPPRRERFPTVVFVAAALFLAALLMVAASSARAAEPYEHETSMTASCEPPEGAVGVARICQGTVTDISPKPSPPAGRINFDGGYGCALVAITSSSSSCGVQATPTAAGTYSVEVFFAGGVSRHPNFLSFFANSATTTLVAGAAGSTPVSASSLTLAGLNPPSMEIDTKPAKRSRSRTATFTFSSEQEGARFECKLDKGFFRPCTAPRRWHVGTGAHIFLVRVISATGTYGEHPLQYRWRVLPRGKRAHHHRPQSRP